MKNFINFLHWLLYMILHSPVIVGISNWVILTFALSLSFGTNIVSIIDTNVQESIPILDINISSIIAGSQECVHAVAYVLLVLSTYIVMVVVLTSIIISVIYIVILLTAPNSRFLGDNRFNAWVDRL